MPADSNKRTSSNPYHYKPCYNCGKIDYTKVKSAWWGGLLGPQLLHHVSCNHCQSTYNGKTGQSNNKAILGYVTAIILVATLLLYGLSLLGLL
jgi:hypothetical protein